MKPHDRRDKKQPVCQLSHVQGTPEAAIAVGAAILGFIIVYCFLGFVAGLIVLAVSLLAGAALIFFKQKKGLHTKKEDRGVFIYAYSTKM